MPHGDLFERTTSLENLYAAWKEFRRGKRKKHDVARFEFELEENLLSIHTMLRSGSYAHEPYESFYVSDPKLRHIHKASVRDRVIHQALFRVLYPMFDRQFVHDSYSCRIRKGTHRGVQQLVRYARKVSRNYRANAYVLQCDIRKFFESVDHETLMRLLSRRVSEIRTLQLLVTIIASYEVLPRKGIPLGNVTSQLFANVYLNEFDQWAKHVLKAKYYLRYCDDFAIIHTDKVYLQSIIPQIQQGLQNSLGLSLHPRKITIRKIRQGIDFLGYVVLPHAVVLRTRTRRRIIRVVTEKKEALRKNRITEREFDHSRQSYLGILRHCKGKSTERLLRNP